MLSLLLAPAGALFAPSNTLPVPIAAARHRAPRLEEIAIDVGFYKSAKAALRTALDVDLGTLSEDAVAMIDALSEVSPTRPDPAEDNDLWSGSFSLSTSTLALPGSGVVQQAGAAVEVDDDGRLLLLATIGSAENTDAAVSVCLTGNLTVAADDELELACDQLGLAQVEDSDEAGAAALVAACEAALGITLSVGSSDVQPGLARWNAEPPLPKLRLSQLYLDQELHVVRWKPIGTAEEGCAGGEAEEEAGGDRLVVLFKPA